jgi:hypothetical protein
MEDPEQQQLVEPVGGLQHLRGRVHRLLIDAHDEIAGDQSCPSSVALGVDSQDLRAVRLAMPSGDHWLSAQTPDVSNNRSDLLGISDKFRHVGMTGRYPFRQRFFQVFDRITEVQ